MNIDHLDLCLDQVKRYASIVINDLRLKHYRLVSELDKLLKVAIENVKQQESEKINKIKHLVDKQNVQSVIVL